MDKDIVAINDKISNNIKDYIKFLLLNNKSDNKNDYKNDMVFGKISLKDTKKRHEILNFKNFTLYHILIGIYSKSNVDLSYSLYIDNNKILENKIKGHTFNYLISENEFIYPDTLSYHTLFIEPESDDLYLIYGFTNNENLMKLVRNQLIYKINDKKMIINRGTYILEK